MPVHKAGQSEGWLATVALGYGVVLTMDSVPTSTTITLVVDDDQLGTALSVQSSLGTLRGIVSPVLFGLHWMVADTRSLSRHAVSVHCWVSVVSTYCGQTPDQNYERKIRAGRIGLVSPEAAHSISLLDTGLRI